VALPVDTAKFRFRDNGRKIREARKLTGLSQENFAPLIGTGRRHMIKLENGEHRPSGVLRDRIVELTGTQERIESSDDEEEEDLSFASIYPDADLGTVLWLRTTGKKHLRRALEIEKALA
jgi:transcriptional regulator with XRE-family HTH domain